MLKILKHPIKQKRLCQIIICRSLRHVIHQTPRTKQNQFYFERSKLLDQVIVKDGESPLNDRTYRELYQKIPVVLVLGWAGSKEPHVHKYEQIYSNLGYHTIRFAPTNKLTFIDWRLHKSYTHHLLDMMRELHLLNNTIITHMFSNAGCFIIYQHLLIDPAAEFFRKNQKLAIFDSGLGLPHKFFRLILGINNLLKSSISTQPLRYMASIGMVATYRIYHYAHLGKHYFSNMFHVVVNDKRDLPILFMYSKQDTIISHKSMAKFVTKRRALGFDIDEVAYEDCDHCMIYPKYSEDYLRRVYRHLEISKVDMKSIFNGQSIQHGDDQFRLPNNK